MDNIVTLKLPLDQVEGIVRALNALPTSSNAWPLVQNILNQMAEQKEEKK